MSLLLLLKALLIREQTNLQNNIAEAEANIDNSQTLPGELRNMQNDITSKRERLDALRAELRASNYDERLSERITQVHALEAKRTMLNRELRDLSTHADTRAKLDLKREEVRRKKTDVENT